MAWPHLKQILVNIKQGLFHRGYVVFGFSEDWFELEMETGHRFIFWSIRIIFGLLSSLIVMNGFELII